ncbi:hypothetical protein TYRP_005545 [Tyrophagus putrescentiae]|nr:hypothetical protein TYRP_005545 [Tyrophagus putrescentiae]
MFITTTTTILVILNAFSLKVGGSSETVNAERTCKHLQQCNDTRIDLLSVLHHHNSSSSTLLLITTEQLVYELPLGGRFLDSTLNLSNASPVALQQKWLSLKKLQVPESSSSTRFNRRWLSLVDGKGRQWLLLFDGQLVENGLNCTLFSLQTQKVESRLFTYRRKADGLRLAAWRWLSSTEPSTFYLIDNVTLALVKVAVDFGANTIQLDGRPWQLCKHSDTFQGAEQLVLAPSSSEGNFSSSAQCNYRLNWTLPLNAFVSSGFTDGKWFVVLGNASVHLFDAVAVAKPGTVVSVTRLNYSQFIVCSEHGTDDLQLLPKWLVIVIILVTFVLIIAMAFFHVYLLQYEAFQKTPGLMEKEPKKTKPSKKTNNTTGSSNIIKVEAAASDCKECKEIIETRKVRMSQKQAL